MTTQERMLWYDYLKGYTVQLRRQKQFGRYIVDFYCSCAKLVIEVDGSQHYTEDGLIHDRSRTAYLESLGLRVIRFTNDEIENEFEAVGEKIDCCVEERI